MPIRPRQVFAGRGDVDFSVLTLFTLFTLFTAGSVFGRPLLLMPG